MKEIIVLVDDSGARLTFHIQQATPPMAVERHKSWVEYDGRTGMTDWHDSAENAAMHVTDLVASALEQGWRRQ